MLLYARTTNDIQSIGDFHTNDGNVLMVRTLDLAQDFEGIKNDLDLLVSHKV
jgi:hypothetical protein